MQIPPSPGSQRGAIRPQAREGGIAPRPTGPPVRRPGSMDGVVKVPKAEMPEVMPDVAPAVAPAVIETSGTPTIRSTVPVAAQAEVRQVISSAEPEPLDEKQTKRALRAENHAAKKAALAGTMGSGKRDKRRRLIVAIIAIIVALFVAYFAYDVWVTNSRAEAVLTSPATTANSSEWSKDDEGKDESELPANALESYVVEASAPRALYIDKLDIAARIMPMALNTDESIQAPKNIFDAGWYNGSVKPGEPGAMFIDGHASGATREGIFAYLDTLTDGDELQVEKGDGEKLTYRVVHVETVALGDVDMRKVLLPYENTSKALNLMTCTGAWLPVEKTYDKRVIVYTEQV